MPALFFIKEKAMCDVYLGGTSNSKWRDAFKSEICDDISIFDPFVDTYEHYNEEEQANQTAREFFHLERCNVVAFYLDENWKGAMSLIELGDSVGRGKNVVVCAIGGARGTQKVQRYCEYRGVVFVESMEDLITTVEEFLAQIEICEANDIDFE